ncbi:protein argonaute 4-like isoform X2 [Daucus carota subsp. sativus]|uniref:protein argonaute 4-like isoform X2 n=1 Tax=Daucus carota subsp. sativus TaxID=79200 RepID=UPI003082AA95
MIQLGRYKPYLVCTILFSELLLAIQETLQNITLNKQNLFIRICRHLPFGLEIHEDIYRGLIWLLSHHDVVEKERIASLRAEMKGAGFGESKVIMEASDAEVNGANETNGVNGTNGVNRTNGAVEEPLPPPPPIPEDVVPVRVDRDLEPLVRKPPCVPIARRGLASIGNKVQFLTNHFKVNVTNVDGHFSLQCCYEDGRPVDLKGIDRKVHDRVHDTYKGELEGKDFAYDEGKSLFTVGALSRNKLEFTVVLQDMSSNNKRNCSPALLLMDAPTGVITKE